MSSIKTFQLRQRHDRSPDYIRGRAKYAQAIASRDALLLAAYAIETCEAAKVGDLSQREIDMALATLHCMLAQKTEDGDGEEQSLTCLIDVTMFG